MTVNNITKAFEAMWYIFSFMFDYDVPVQYRYYANIKIKFGCS